MALAVLAFLVAVSVAVPLGVTMGVLTRGGRRRRTELSFTTTSVVLGTISDIIFGVVLVAIFAVKLEWLPVAGRGGPDSYVLPVLALAIGPAFILARIVRVEMVSVLDADFVRTARAKRLPAPVIYLGNRLVSVRDWGERWACPDSADRFAKPPRLAGAVAPRIQLA